MYINIWIHIYVYIYKYIRARLLPFNSHKNSRPSRFHEFHNKLANVRIKPKSKSQSRTIRCAQQSELLLSKKNIVAQRVPGLGQITWWFMDEKNDGPFGGQNCTEIEKYFFRFVLFFLQLQAQSAIFQNPRTKYKRSENVFLCHIYCAQLCAHLRKIVEASCAFSNRESRYPRCTDKIVRLHTWFIFKKIYIYIYIYKSASCRSIQQSKTFCSSLDLVSLPLSLSLSLMLLLWSHPKFPIPFVSKNCSSACLRVHSVLKDLVIISRLLVLFSVTKRNDNSITLTPPFLGPDTLTPPFLSLDHCQSLWLPNADRF